MINFINASQTTNFDFNGTLNKTYLIWFRSQVHISRELVALCWCHIVVSMFSVGISVATWLKLIKYCIYNLIYLSNWLLSLHFIIKYFSLLHNYYYYLTLFTGYSIILGCGYRIVYETKLYKTIVGFEKGIRLTVSWLEKFIFTFIGKIAHTAIPYFITSIPCRLLNCWVF